MCEGDHPIADQVPAIAHDHEQAGEDQLLAAFSSDLDSPEQEAALRLAEVEARLALARNVGRIADALEGRPGRPPHKDLGWI